MPLGGTTHRFWLPAKPIEPTPYSVTIDIDEDFPVRSRAADRLWRALNNRPLGPSDDGLTPQQRARIGQALQALDGHLTGASYRTIAEVLFGSRRVSESAWKTADLRSRTIRLVQFGLRLMRGGLS